MTETPKKENTTLKVLESYTRDVGRGIARIDYSTMKILNVSVGDILEIKGKKRTVAKCLPLYPSDESKHLIRIDGLGRTNGGIVIGDTITVRKIKAVSAQKVIVAPLEAIPPIDERYLADALESVPLVKGDNVMIPYFGGRLTFEIETIVPQADAVVVTQKTVFEILSEKTIVEAKKVVAATTSNFFSDLEDMYADEFGSLQKCLDDDKLFNELVGKLLIRTNGALAPSTAGKFVESMAELSKQ